MKSNTFIIALFIIISFNLSAQNDDYKKFNISEQQLKTHKLVLENASDIRSTTTFNLRAEDIAETKKAIFKKFAPPTISATPAFDANYFGPIVHESLKGKVVGYMYQVYQGNNVVYTGLWNWAKKPIDGDKGWTADTRMHIASVSKLMTAIGLVKLLDKKGIPLDAPISVYLPTYWKKGTGVSGVTFRKLLNHTSGFSGENSRGDYTFMKQQIAKGPNVSPPHYANVNFSLMRVLITIIDGHLAANNTFGLPDGMYLDAVWDVLATQYFQTYMNREVFSVAGLPTIGFSPPIGIPSAKAYSSINDPLGRDGDWSTVSGGAGFYMSVAQILKTLGAFRSGMILPAARAKYMLDNGLGNNGKTSTPAGTIYNRLGGWSVNDGEEQAAIYCLPNNVNIAAFVNSSVYGFNQHIHGLIYPAIEASIH